MKKVFVEFPFGLPVVLQVENNEIVKVQDHELAKKMRERFLGTNMEEFEESFKKEYTGKFWVIPAERRIDLSEVPKVA